MAKAKLTITAEVEKFKENENGNIMIITKAETSKQVPKGLKELGSSAYIINVNPKTWKKVSDKLQGNRILFTGEPKAAVTEKGVPFTIVNCFDVSIIEPKEKNNQSEPEKTKPTKPVQSVNEKDKKAAQSKKQKEVNKDNTDIKALNLWRKNQTNVINIKVSDLVLTEENHLRGFNQNSFTSLQKYTIKYPLIVRTLENGKFTLVLGYKDYVVAKILNFETVPAIITEYTRQILIEEAQKVITGENEVSALVISEEY